MLPHQSYGINHHHLDVVWSVMNCFFFFLVVGKNLENKNRENLCNKFVWFVFVGWPKKNTDSIWSIHKFCIHKYCFFMFVFAFILFRFFLNYWKLIICFRNLSLKKPYLLISNLMFLYFSHGKICVFDSFVICIFVWVLLNCVCVFF